MEAVAREPPEESDDAAVDERGVGAERRVRRREERFSRVVVRYFLLSSKGLG